MPDFDFSRLFAARSLAFIGGVEAGKAIVQTEKLGFDGEIWAVNPYGKTVADRECYAHIGDLPSVPDAAFVAIPPDPSIETIEALASAGCGGAVCYASGFSEIGGAGPERQQKLIAAAGSMPVIGPNCYGYLNYLNGIALWPDVQGGSRLTSGVAVIMQSGNISINVTMQDRSLPLAVLISVGNQAQVGIAELTRALVEDPRITAIGIHVEAIGNLEIFADAAMMAAEKNTPIVALKTGKSAKGTQIALSHTSSMAGSARAYASLFDRLGVASVDSLPQFLETLKFLSRHPTLPGNRIFSLSCSGGEAALVADASEEIGLELPPLTKFDHDALHRVLGDRVSIDNPLDYHTYVWGLTEEMRACYATALKTDVDAAILVLDYVKPGLGDDSGWDVAEAAIIAAHGETGMPTIVVSSLHESLPLRARDALIEGGIVPIYGIEEALRAVKAAATIGVAWRRGISRPMQAPDLKRGRVVTIDEYRSKKMLAAHGLGIPDGSLVSSPTEAVAAAEATGFPVVVKAVGANLAHKTEAGAVALNLTDGDAVHAATERMRALSKRFLVERMMTGVVAELIVGVTREPGIGPVLLIGAGGIAAELIGDTKLLTLPVDAAAIRCAIKGLKTGPLLTGYRGRPAGDTDAVVKAVMAIAAFAISNADRLVELDVNPLIVLEDGNGAVAADALIRLIEG